MITLKRKVSLKQKGTYKATSQKSNKLLLWGGGVLAVALAGASFLAYNHFHTNNENNSNSAKDTTNIVPPVVRDTTTNVQSSDTIQSKSKNSGIDAGVVTPSDAAKSTVDKAKTDMAQLGDTAINIEGSTQALANDVIAGKYANWPERERKLGKRYKEIQSKVNEMYRNGLVK